MADSHNFIQLFSLFPSLSNSIQIRIQLSEIVPNILFDILTNMHTFKNDFIPHQISKSPEPFSLIRRQLVHFPIQSVAGLVESKNKDDAGDVVHVLQTFQHFFIAFASG